MANNLERSEVSVSDDRHIASWDKASDYHINSYHNAWESLLSNVRIPSDLLLCHNVLCEDVSHIPSLGHLYEDIVNALCTASAQHLPVKKAGSHPIIPGWNDYIREAHTQARHSFLL